MDGFSRNEKFVVDVKRKVDLNSTFSYMCDGDPLICVSKKDIIMVPFLCYLINNIETED